MLKTIQLTSFNSTEHMLSAVSRPNRYRDLFELVEGGSKMIARGAGLSYPAASMADGVTSIDMRYFD